MTRARARAEQVSQQGQEGRRTIRPSGFAADQGTEPRYLLEWFQARESNLSKE